MIFKDAIEYLLNGKCKTVTHLSWPRTYSLTLWKYTCTYWNLYYLEDIESYSIYPEFVKHREYQRANDKRSPDSLIMYVGNSLDSIERNITKEMYKDNNWRIMDIMYESI